MEDCKLKDSIYMPLTSFPLRLFWDIPVPFSLSGDQLGLLVKLGLRSVLCHLTFASLLALSQFPFSFKLTALALHTHTHTHTHTTAPSKVLIYKFCFGSVCFGSALIYKMKHCYLSFKSPRKIKINLPLVELTPYWSWLTNILKEKKKPQFTGVRSMH